ncbi:MAG: hypothetical protein GXP56_03510 [Deltaproteobacteria bacterium]|nr:hypothetical protein [Deltaproteobacteria bacterium]
MTKKFLIIAGLLFFFTMDAFAGLGLTRENPITFDKDKKTVSFLAEVNGKYMFQPTRHFAVYEKGSNGEKAVFRGLVSHLDFYNALLKINAVPGNNMSLKNKEVTHVEGQEFAVTVTWKGADRAYTIDEVIDESNHTPIVMKFGGNLKNAKDKNTGCLLCLDSCPVGIVSNSVYTYGAVLKRKEVSMKGNKDVLPPDGTRVVITLTAK